MGEKQEPSHRVTAVHGHTLGPTTATSSVACPLSRKGAADDWDMAATSVSRGASAVPLKIKARRW